MELLSFIFTEPYDAQEFVLCFILCSVYFVAVIASLQWVFKQQLGTVQQLAYLNVYSLFMSLPLMPFVAGFSTLILTLFTFSNFIWQRIKLIHDGYDPKRFMIGLSVCHMMGWIALSLFHYWFSDGIMNILLPEDAWLN